MKKGIISATIIIAIVVVIAFVAIVIGIFFDNNSGVVPPVNPPIEGNCGNGICDVGENGIICPQDCSKVQGGLCPEGRSDGFSIKFDECTCPTGKVMETAFTGAWTGFVECYTPASDYGQYCDEETDCESNVCIVQDNKLPENCVNRKVDGCTFVEGQCGAGKEEGGIFITKKNTISIVYLD